MGLRGCCSRSSLQRHLSDSQAAFASRRRSAKGTVDTDSILARATAAGLECRPAAVNDDHDDSSQITEWHPRQLATQSSPTPPTSTPVPSMSWQPTVVPTMRPTTPPNLVVSGVCAGNAAGDIDDVYAPIGITLDGRWYYEGESNGVKLYFDRDCDGASSSSRWIFDKSSIQVSVTAEYDLDADAICIF